MATDTTVSSDVEPVDDDIDDIGDISLTDPTPVPDTPGDTAENAKDEGADTEEKKEADVEAKDTEAKPDEAPEKAEEPEKGKPDPDKARQAYRDRQQKRQEVARKIDEVYAPKTKQDLVDEGMPDAKAEIEALRQEIAFKDQRQAISELNAGLQYDAMQVQQDFDVYDPNSKEYDPEFTQKVDQAYYQASRFQSDEYGNVLNAEVGLYDFYKQMADIYSRGASKNSEQATTEAIQMLSRTENPGGAPPKSSGDSLADLEEKLGDVVIT